MVLVFLANGLHPAACLLLLVLALVVLGGVAPAIGKGGGLGVAWAFGEFRGQSALPRTPVR